MISPFIVGIDIAFLVEKYAMMDNDEKARLSHVVIWNSIAMDTPSCPNTCPWKAQTARLYMSI